MLRKGDWVLVADGEKALLLENVGDTETPDLALRERTEQKNPPDRDQATDRPGRQNDNGPGQKSAMDKTDFHERAKMLFADGTAEFLDAEARRGAFDRIVLVAAPAVLGEIRARLTATVAEKVLAEVPKTLTNHPLDQIGRIVLAELV